MEDTLLTTTCQRWRLGRDSRRPAAEPINTARYACDEIDERAAKRFVLTHHYARSYPAARIRIGLFRAGAGLVGVAVFATPMNNATINKYLDAQDGCELGRLVLLDDVEANGETWFLGRCFRILRQRHPHIGGIVSYSDPLPRTTVQGELIKPGHIGTIYQASNARYVGRATAQTLVLDDAGRVISRRSLSKLRNDERGAAAVYEQLLRAGAPRRKESESGADYCDRAIARGPFRLVRHPGNLTYVWSLNAETTIRLPARPYEKAETIERQQPLFPNATAPLLRRCSDLTPTEER